MIIVKLQGGLGNQMFQYALGRNLSLIHNVPFKIDSSYLRKPNQSRRTFLLDGFNIAATEATVAEIAQYRSTFQKVLDWLRPEPKRKKVLEHSPDFDPSLLKRSDGYFDGHWHNKKYFQANEQTIRKDFTLKNPFGASARETSEKIKSEHNATSLHIRRGDYVTISKIAAVHGTLPLSYYETACEIILDKNPDAHFFISSDDIAWSKANFPKNLPATFISSPEISECEELTLMSMCKHNIIANSTFSWWGAWLNTNSDKIVIAPKDWYHDPNRNAWELMLPYFITL